MINPVMVESTRGHHVESRHRGIAAVVDSQGHIIRSWGSIFDSIFGRSALKLVQALPLIESGAADAFHITPEEIALACASHHGEDQHVRVLEAWFHKLGKDERVLECGPQRPLYLSYSKKQIPHSEKPSQIHNACSGKHLGFLTTAKHRKDPLEGYISKDHAAQIRVEHALSELTGVDLVHAPHGVDGCGIPAFAIPLYNIALAMARFADPSHLHYPRQKAIHRILEAVKVNPNMIAGTNGFDTKLIKLSQGKVLCKGGAGGVEVGIIPSLGFGIALKIEDGNPKAAELAFLAILNTLGVLDEDLYEAMNPRIPILTHKGKTVGFMQPTHFTMMREEVGKH
jgi:L-asparaginase II